MEPKIWIPHPPTVIPFLLVDSCRKNKVRTNELEILWKNRNRRPNQNYLVLTKKKLYILSNTKATFEAQFMKKLSNTEAELKKSVAYKKSLYFTFIQNFWMWYYCNQKSEFIASKWKFIKGYYGFFKYSEIKKEIKSISIVNYSYFLLNFVYFYAFPSAYVVCILNLSEKVGINV